MCPTISDNDEGRLDPPNTFDILKDYTNSFSAGLSQSLIKITPRSKIMKQSNFQEETNV